MAKLVLTNCGILLGGYDVQPYVSSLQAAYAADMLPVTTFGSGGVVERLGGLKATSLSLEGFWDGGTAVDGTTFGTVGAVGTVITATPDGAAADGERAFLGEFAQGVYNLSAPVGDAFRFSASGELSGPFVRGLIMHRGVRTTSGNGTARQIAAVGAGARVYASLHVYAASGGSPTLDVVVQSDDGAGMASPTTRITFAQATGVGAQFLSAAGPITDDYWRVSWTIGGSTPSFSFAAAIGIY